MAKRKMRSKRDPDGSYIKVKLLGDKVCIKPLTGKKVCMTVPAFNALIRRLSKGITVLHEFSK